jgi:hypothetical protein
MSHSSVGSFGVCAERIRYLSRWIVFKQPLESGPAPFDYRYLIKCEQMFDTIRVGAFVIISESQTKPGLSRTSFSFSSPL